MTQKPIVDMNKLKADQEKEAEERRKAFNEYLDSFQEKEDEAFNKYVHDYYEKEKDKAIEREKAAALNDKIEQDILGKYGRSRKDDAYRELAKGVQEQIERDHKEY